MEKQDKAVDIFCRECVKAPEEHWLHNPVSVTFQARKTLIGYEDGMKSVSAACHLYMGADAKMSPRCLKRLYKQIARFLTQSGIPADYCPEEEHKVQSGYKSLAIVEGLCVFFQFRKPVASVRMTYPELWACIVRRMMMS